MKRRISLYIDGSLADLTDDGMVLFNYAVSDVSNPAAVKNSYSQTITLPGTDANNRIFGSSFRLDRTIGTGGFNASQRTPFAIYDEAGEVLASGYAKLDRVLTAGGSAHSYEVSLFGGLGGFLYEMSMKPTGDKLSLADLDYGEDIDFEITKENVADAWARLGGDTSKAAKWDIVNFAPALNGIPSDFAADKAVALAADIGLPAPVVEGDDTYDTNSGYTLVSLPEAADEWAVKDLRSYLQRPVVSFRAILAAIARTSTWSVDLSDLADVPFVDAWLTRPLLPSLGGYRQSSGVVTLTPYGTSVVSVTSYLGKFDVADAPAGATLTARMRYSPTFAITGLTTQALYSAADLGSAFIEQVIFIQAIGYASDNTKVAAGNVVAIYYEADSVPPEEMASRCGFTPDALNGNYENPVSDYGVVYRGNGSGLAVRDAAVSFGIEGVNIAYIEIHQEVYALDTDSGIAQAGTALFNGTAQMTTDGACAPDALGTGTITTADTLRSGGLVTKSLLLSSSATPAEYLISFCKMAGLYILADAHTKSVRIIKRKTFYEAETIDLTKRVDRSKDIDITPLPFDAKWYELRHEGVGGAFEKEYEQVEGVQYGIQRIDTGYSFDAEKKDLLSGSALRSAAEVLNYSKMLNVITDGGHFAPSPFINPGGKYTLWRSGDGKDFDVPAISAAATIDWMDATYPGYDKQTRVEFRDKDGKALDGADVLLMYRGTESYDQVFLTDDLAIMDTLNGGPCWLLQTASDAALDVPSFTRVAAGGEMLDFGTPRQVCSPYNFLAGCTTLYELAWKRFIADRLDMNGKVLKCRVNLSGLQVGPELLRRFYWYGGSLWSLVKISNYSLTTFDPAECEFVQVRDKSNYLTGQY